MIFLISKFELLILAKLLYYIVSLNYNIGSDYLILTPANTDSKSLIHLL